MKIGLLIYGSLETVSGGYLYNRQLVDYLRAQGDSVTLVQIPFRSFWQHLTDNFQDDLTQRLAQLDVDVLIQDEMAFASLAWLNKRLKRRVRYPIVALVHLLAATDALGGVQRALRLMVERRYLRSVDGFICTSVTTQRELVARYGILRRSVVAYPGGDRFEQVTSAPSLAERAGQSPLRLLYVGNVIRRKGLHLVLRAMARLDDVVLWVVGPLSAEPTYTRTLFNLIDQLNLTDRVHFLGPLDGDALAEQYQCSHCFVMPSSYESFGIVYLEAQQFGLPVIATTAGAASELVTNGHNGFLIAPDDANSLHDHLQTLRDDRATLIAMGRAAQHRFAAHPNWQTGLAGVRQFLHEIQR